MYGKAFFKRRIKRYRVKELQLAALLYKLYEPQQVYDAGCAIGSYLEGFAELGCKVAGSEKYWPAAKEFAVESVRDKITQHDMTVPWSIEPKYFDLVLCIEVAEHVDPEGSDQLVQNLVSLLPEHGKGRIIFTAAPPGQPGKGHINCRSHLEWIGLFGVHGAMLDVDETGDLEVELSEIGDPLDLAKNIHIFKRVPRP